MAEGGDEEVVATRVSRSRGSRKPSLARVTIRSGFTGGVTGIAVVGR
jgi:hypothetical protein